ncbi:odorant receptor 13a-like [Odontomachus brunneus]|uniref:odorant receptor 13a-like n=1 Tax=Odontomachus brunneus TaxID=486640 RepID=UPI0013F2691B|nr:odorant receptor 13a-like [Odontomachus brunneus]
MAGERWNNDIAYAMTPFKLLMWPMGGWPLQVYNVYSLMRCVTVTFGMSIVVILPFIEIYLGCTDAGQNVDALMIIFCGSLAMAKMIWFRIYASNLIKTYKYAVDDYLTVENAEQRAIMLRHAFIARTLMCTMVAIAYFDSFVYSLMPILNTLSKNQTNVTQEDVVLEYTLPSRCALEYLNAPRNMYITNCIMELIMMLLVCTSNYGNDSLFLHIALHICGQVKILKSKFINFELTEPQIQNRFNALIQRHSHLVEMTKILTDAISFILLMQLFLSSLLLCILGFQFILALKNNDGVMMVRSFMVLNAFLAQITTYCVVGDYLKSQMEEVGVYIYQSTWYKFPAKLTKNLTFLIMRSQSPVQLQAGNFIVSIIVILPSIELYLGCADADRNVDALMLAVCGIIAMTKMIWFRIYASNLTKTYKFAVNDYLMIEDAEQRAIMLRHSSISKILMCSMVSLAYFDSFILSLVPILGSSGKAAQKINETQEDILLEYTVPSRCALEYLNAPRSMHTTHCIVELIMLLLVCTSNFGNDSLFLHIALHICGQVKILKSKFINFDLTRPQIYDRYHALIQRHGHLMEMTKILANAVSFVLLMQLFLSSILLCIQGFQLILALKVNDTIMMVKSFMILNCFLTQITIYCVIGDYLKTQMEEVGFFIFQSAWYNLPAKLMKNLSFIIMRSQYPVQLQAGNFIVINLETYMSILKTSISYLSVLRVMIET